MDIFIAESKRESVRIKNTGLLYRNLKVGNVEIEFKGYFKAQLHPRSLSFKIYSTKFCAELRKRETCFLNLKIIKIFLERNVNVNASNETIFIVKSSSIFSFVFSIAKKSVPHNRRSDSDVIVYSEIH